MFEGYSYEPIINIIGGGGGPFLVSGDIW